MKKKFIGTGVALITPFTKNGTVDYTALEKLVAYQIKNNVNYLVVLGTTGEPATLQIEEKKKVIATIIKANAKRLPLVLGIGGNSTSHVINEIKATNLDDFDAILSVSPYYNRPTQQGIYTHFKEIAAATKKPIIVYNVPHRTGQNITPETILRLAKDCKNIIAVKDAASDMQQTLQLLKNKPSDFLIISGDDSLALPSIMAGGAGVISVIGQGMPKEFTTMINLGLQQKSKEAFRLYYKLMDLTNLIFKEGNPAGIKTVLQQKNICETAVRLPLIEASKELQAEISKSVSKIANSK